MFPDQFKSDYTSYNQSPESLYIFRLENNKFYTKQSKDIFEKQLEKLRQEFKIKR